MQIDFHYCTIRVLAEKAGFNHEDAQTIAIASQYIDDATLYRPIRLPKFLKFDSPRIKGNYFDPVCTAHKGFQMFTDFNKSIQMKVYLSFHFLPSKIYENQHIYDYLVSPNSQFAQRLVTNALDYIKQNPENRNLGLIKLGIALHTFADTFAHQGFSGRHNCENNVENVFILHRNNKWYKLSRFRRFRAKLMPEIGHAEALSLPDYPFKIWRYIQSENKAVVRNNIDIYIEAANEIYKILCKISLGKPKPFAEFSYKLIKLFSTPSKSAIFRFFLFQMYFPEIIFFYNSKQWILELLNPLNHIIIGKKNVEQKWLLFHQAASEQRNFVLQNIKPL